MRETSEIVDILASVKAATPPPPEPLPPEKRSLFYLPDPQMRRTYRLVVGGRLATLNGLASFLAQSADVPDWIARLALDAAIPVDHEAELDDPANHLPALERAAMAMGLDPACLTSGGEMHS